jgi:hypothetical protein
MNFLRQATAVDIAIGPFLDDDGITPATGLSITQAECRLKKNNGAWAQVSDATTATHEEEGWYEKELDATDTNTCGILIVAVYISGNLAYWKEFQVVEEAVYDLLYAASATGVTTVLTTVASDLVQIYSDTTRIDSNTVLAETNISDIESSLVIIKSDLVVLDDLLSDVHSSLVITKSDLVVIDDLASNIHSSLVIAKSDLVIMTGPHDGTAGVYPGVGIIDQGTAQSATATTMVLRAATPFGSDDAINGAVLWALGSTQGYWQARFVTDYTTADDTATVDTWDVTPSGTITYKVFGTAPGAEPTALTATQESQLTRIQSDLIIAQSDLIIIGSDLLQVYSDTSIIYSDTTAAEANISDIESSLVIVKSDLVVIDDLASDIHSSLVIAKSDLVLLTAPGDGTAGAYPAYQIVDQGTAQGATGTTIVLRSAASFANDTAIGMTVLAFGSTQGYWQSRAITDYDLATDTATVSTWTVTPSGTITYKVIGTAPVSISALTAQQSSQLTRVQSDLIVTQSDLLQVYSDTTAIHSDTTVAESNISDIESSLVIVKSDIVILTSDTTAIHLQTTTATSDLVQVYSDTTAIHSDTTHVHSDTTAIHLQTTTIASDLVQVYSDTTRIDSNTVLAETNISDIESSLVIIKSDLVIITSDIGDIIVGEGGLTSDQDSKLTRIASDVIALDSPISDIESSLVIIKSDLVVIEAIASDAKSSLVIVKSDLVISNSDTTAIQTKTDSLTFTVAGNVDANTQRINDVAITGDGSAGDKFDVV